METVEVLSSIRFECEYLRYYDLKRVPVPALVFVKDEFSYFYVVQGVYSGTWFGPSKVAPAISDRVRFENVFDELPDSDKDVVIFNLDIFT